MNVTQLQSPPPLPSHMQRVSKEASEKNADFLVLRLLNKRARVRLSPQPLDLDALPGQGRLFAVANSKGCFAATVRGANGSYGKSTYCLLRSFVNKLIAAPLADLHSTFASLTNMDADFSPKTNVALPGVPQTVMFAHNDTRLIICLVDGSIIVFDTQLLLSGGVGVPLHTFPSSMPIRQIVPNPGDMSELVAVLRSPESSGLPVEVYDVQNMKSVGGWRSGSTPNTRPTALSWSPKGKQLAIGLESGDIVTYSPTATGSLKSLIPKPATIGEESVIAIDWITNTEFHAVFSGRGDLNPDSEQSHYIVSFDSKANQVGDVKLNSPYLPFPGLRPPGQFVANFRNWGSARFLLFIGDSTSSDIGLLGSITELGSPLETWCNLSLEETSTPTVPLDKDMNDTVLLALDVDLTSTKPFRLTQASGEEVDVPPPPILYAYASDGTLTGWHVVNSQGTPYPGMIDVSGAVQRSQSGESSSAIFAVRPGASAASPTIFSTTPTSSPSKGGFEAFASGSAKFGQTGFSMDTSTAPLSTVQPGPEPVARAPSIAEEAMDSEATNAGFGGLSLGGTDASSGSPTPSTSSVFGSFTAQHSSMSSVSPTFGTSGFSKPSAGFGAFANLGAPSSSSPFAAAASSMSSDIKPAAGFGAFANLGTPSSYAFSPAVGSSSSSTLAVESKRPSAFGQQVSAPSFGQPAFGQPAFGKPAFGQPTFGQSAAAKSAFGQPAFGQTSFGKAETESAKAGDNNSTASTSGGGFSAFAQAGPVSFGSATPKADAKPPWASRANDESARVVNEKEKSRSIFEPLKAEQPQTPSRTPDPGASQPNVKAFADLPKEASKETTKEAPQTAADSPKPFTPSAPSGISPLTSKSGAFGQLQTSPFGFGQISAGFGAFGSADVSSSPFFKAAKQELPPPTAFLGGSSPPPTVSPTADPTKPTFGAPSALGNARSVFGSPGAGTLTTPSPSPNSGAFAAFSGSKSAFGVSGASGISFGDLLRQKSDEDEKARASGSPKTPSRSQNEASGSVFSAFARQGNTPVRTGSLASPPDSESESDSEIDDGEEDEDAVSTARVVLPQGEFIDDTAEFLSDEFSDESESELVEVTPVATADSTKKVPNETILKVPTTVDSLSSPGEATKVGTSPTRDPSTTPPGSPSPVKSAASPSLPSPSPSPNSATPTGFPSLGLGRPSTRPTRSSPLASAPITGDDDNDDEPKLSTGRRVSTSAQVESGSKRSRDEEQPQTSRPKTPPLSSTFGPSTPSSVGSTNDKGKGKAPAFGSLNFTPKPSPTPPPSVFSLQGQTSMPSPSIGSNSAPLLSSSTGENLPSSFSPKPAPPISPALSSPSSIFGNPSMVSPVSQTSGSQARPAFVQGSSNRSTAAQQVSGKSAEGPIAEAAVLVEGMQAECLRLFGLVRKELDQLRVVSQDAGQKKDLLYKSGIGSGTNAAPMDMSKWTIGDLVRLQPAMLVVEKELAGLKGRKADYEASIQELEGHLLKASARKEEVVRFSKASSDAGFARMLKARTLAPEHLEAQSQLRRDIRVLRDRLRQLEDHIQASKKKAKLMRAGKPELKAPSLDTINRIYRNIDGAIDQHEDEVAQLTARAARLSMRSARSTPSKDRDTTERENARSSEVTPHFARSTAAALNAEMSAHKLKRALLQARKEPLLNTQAVSATPAVPTPEPLSTSRGIIPNMVKEEAPASPQLSFSIPRKSMPSTPEMAKAPSIPTTPATPATPTPDFDDDTSHSPGTGSRHRSGGRYHAKAVPLKKTSPSPSAAANFDWGPLPNVSPSSTQTMSKLPVPLQSSPSPSPATRFNWGALPDVSPSSARTPNPLPVPLTSSSSLPSASISGASLSASWVVEGFEGKK
ncbi:uncharacterized protein FIBRA_06868 [Fibroporia radiculosa]|uniref:Nucleoporin Nup159/Nup146 N-terminal domain-containing protein n=1 Tax=Fibroporia radiculosa TaxID=599839 RepID=J4HZS5_9APHY|nr:uncharacterized protein FIBRA_06868 [Fibroporia radiculosa]CCM04682.1 predicted protein [Fibroporia radiculosa]